MRSRYWTACVIGWATLLGALASATAGEFFAAPDGKPNGDGSRERPWNLTAALQQPASVKPGDTIWLRGGTYRGNFTSQLQGTEQAPVTLRQWPGERATVDCHSDDRSPLFVVSGAWAVYQGFELTSSNPRRTSNVAGSGDLDRGGIHCRASHVKFVNLIIHDVGVGIGFWSEGEGGEIYGCLIYNNGWKGPDRGHGHAIYAQNRNGTKRLVDNILFNQFAYGIHIYGSRNASLEGFHIEGNASFNNGCLSARGDRAPNILVGGGSPARRVALVENYTYHSVPATSVRLGYAAANDDLVCKDNYLHGFNHFQLWKQLTVAGNTFVGPGTLVELDVPDMIDLSDYSWDGNSYLSSEQRLPPLRAHRKEQELARGWHEWHDNIGFDRTGTYSTGSLNGARVFVRPNHYEAGRAHVIVYNWDRRDVVEVDLGELLPQGTAYRVQSAQDYFGDPVLEGVYDGAPVRLPMQPRRAAQPVGMDDYPLPVTGPEFDVFVVVPDARTPPVAPLGKGGNVCAVLGMRRKAFGPVPER